MRFRLLAMGVCCLAVTTVRCGSSSTGAPQTDAGSGGSGSGGGGPTLHALTVAVSGSGRVTSTPAGLDCGATCSAQFAEGTAVALSAQPASGWALKNWTGACSGTSPCIVTLTADTTVGAEFNSGVTPVAVASVSVAQAIATVAVGATSQHTATLRDARNNVLTGRTVTWSSSNSQVATVSATGLVTGVAGGGPVMITALSEGKTGSATITVSATRAVCSGGTLIVAVLVDARLGPSIDAGLDRFERDICADGWTTVELRCEFATPVELRAYLKTYYDSTNRRLDGLILVGSFPRAYQYVVLKSTNPSIPDTREELLSYQYLADLDGVFAASAGYSSAGNHAFSFDLHSGNIDSELWVGVLPLYEGNYATTEAALTRYFQKNHDYRTGASSLPRRFLLVSEHAKATNETQQSAWMDALRTGQYAWTPFSSAADAQIFFDGTTTTVDQGYAALSAGTADFFVGEAHGFAGAHGKLTIAWVESQPVKTSFFWSDGCAVANLDVTLNFITSVLYSPTSSAVVAKGTTNNSGGMGTNSEGFCGHNVATYMSQGHAFGDAVRHHINVPLIFPWSDSREFEIATSIVLGDPTLRLR